MALNAILFDILNIIIIIILWYLPEHREISSLQNKENIRLSYNC